MKTEEQNSFSVQIVGENKTIDNNFQQLLGTYLKYLGISANKFADISGASRRTLNVFLSSNSNNSEIGSDKLKKCFDSLGIDLMQYEKRLLLAYKIAKTLRQNSGRNVTKDLTNYSKQKLYDETQIEEIKLFFDVDSLEQFEDLRKSGLIEMGCTYPYLRSLVYYFLKFDTDVLESARFSRSSSSKAIKEMCKEIKEDVSEQQKQGFSVKMEERNSHTEKGNSSETSLGAFALVGGVLAASAALATWFLSGDEKRN